MPPMGATRMRLERLADERSRTQEKIDDLVAIAEDEKRDLDDAEQQLLDKHRSRYAALEEEIGGLAEDLERVDKSKDVAAVLRPKENDDGGDSPDGPTRYRTFAAYARDEIIVRFPLIASNAARGGDTAQAVENARDRLKRAVQHTLTSDVEGLLPPQHMAQILDIINRSRPVVASGRSVPLDQGKLTYPHIIQRPEVLIQSAEKTVAGTANMQVEMDSLNAQSFLGGGNLSWQTINWTTPNALQLWFDLASEAYARQTEKNACDELDTDGGGTATHPLGTTGTEDFAAWRKSVLSAMEGIYTASGGRAQTDTLWLSAQRFFQLAGVGTDQILQVSVVGQLDASAMTGTWAGLRVVGSYGFTDQNAAVVGDSNALLVGEVSGSPVELRAVEPAIGGMEVGVIGGFASKVFDPTRFMHLS